MSQKRYLLEVQERSSIELDEVKLADSLESPEVCTMVENAYRRGVFQGAATFLRYMQAKATTDVLNDWLHTRLHDWRYKTHDGAFEPTPQLAVVEGEPLPPRIIENLDQSWSHAKSLRDEMRQQLDSGHIDNELSRCAVILVLAELAFRDSQ
jgi:hypothetical protein